MKNRAVLRQFADSHLKCNGAVKNKDIAMRGTIPPPGASNYIVAKMVDLNRARSEAEKSKTRVLHAANRRERQAVERMQNGASNTKGTKS